MMFRQKRFRDSRLVVVPVEGGLGGDPYQVAVAFVVFGEDDEVVVGIAVWGGALGVVVVLFADVEFAADDGF
jgi:hypothetical protein